MKRNILLALLAIFTISISAQKSVRKAIRKGNSAFKEQRYSAAETDYAKALEQDATSKQASFNLANTFYKQQRWDEALKEHEHFLTLENEDPKKMADAWSNMGNTYLKKKANEKHQAQGAPQAPPQQGAPPEQAKQIDNLKASMEAYKNALRLNPMDNETRENLAIVQKMIKDQEGDGGGGDDNKDQKQDQEKKEEKKEDQQQDQEKKEDNKEEKKEENQMSQDNIQQILEAIEQDERGTQDRVNQAKAEERKRKSDRNRRQDKDW